MKHVYQFDAIFSWQTVTSIRHRVNKEKSRNFVYFFFSYQELKSYATYVTLFVMNYMHAGQSLLNA